MDLVLTRDVEALGTLKRLSAPSSAVAAGSGDSATTTGVTVDRAAFSPSMPRSLAAAVLFGATLASGKTLSLGYAVQHGDDGTNFTDLQTATYAVVATGPSGGGAVVGELKIPVNLGSAKRYVRLNYATDLNATGTDTAVGQAAGFFAGFSRLPAPAN